MSIFDRKETAPRRVDKSNYPLWCPPEIEPYAKGYPEGNFYSKAYSGKYTREELKAIYEASDFSAWHDPDPQSGVCVREYTVPGCPEEPETPVKVLVYVPEEQIKEKYPVLFFTTGGGMMTSIPEMFPLKTMCVRYQCVIVCPIFRTSWTAPYPASINDCHAAFQWMVSHADELHIDSECVVLHGSSSGGHLATCLPFRLSRYGYRNIRGVVAVVPLCDDRVNYEALTQNKMLDSDILYHIRRYWLGKHIGDPNIGPEAFAMHASVDDCIGYPPLFIHAGEHDGERDNNYAFAQKVQQANSWVEFHSWGGMYHGVGSQPVPVAQRIQNIIDHNIMDCFQYDLRRPFVYEQE